MNSIQLLVAVIYASLFSQIQRTAARDSVHARASDVPAVKDAKDLKGGADLTNAVFQQQSGLFQPTDGMARLRPIPESRPLSRPNSLELQNPAALPMLDSEVAIVDDVCTVVPDRSAEEKKSNGTELIRSKEVAPSIAEQTSRRLQTGVEGKPSENQKPVHENHTAAVPTGVAPQTVENKGAEQKDAAESELVSNNITAGSSNVAVSNDVSDRTDRQNSVKLPHSSPPAAHVQSTKLDSPLSSCLDAAGHTDLLPSPPPTPPRAMMLATISTTLPPPADLATPPASPASHRILDRKVSGSGGGGADVKDGGVGGSANIVATELATKTSTPDSVDLPPPPSPPSPFCQTPELPGCASLPPLPPPPLDEISTLPPPISSPTMPTSTSCAPEQQTLPEAVKLSPTGCDVGTQKPSTANGSVSLANGSAKHLPRTVLASLDPTTLVPQQVDAVSITSNASSATVSSGSTAKSDESAMSADQPLIRDTRSDLLAAIREGNLFCFYVLGPDMSEQHVQNVVRCILHISSRFKKMPILSLTSEVCAFPGIKLRKVEERRQKTEQKFRPARRLDVQTIMEAAFEMRRKALEENESDEEEEEDELDGNWSDAD